MSENWKHIIPQKNGHLWNPKFGTIYKISVHYLIEGNSNFRNLDAVYLNTRGGEHMFYFIDSVDYRLRKAVSKIDSEPCWERGPDGESLPHFKTNLVNEEDMRLGEEEWVNEVFPALKKQTI